MDAAFRLGSAAPAAGARILVRRGPAGAGHASDREKTGCYQRMGRQSCLRVDRLDFLARGIGERVELQPAAVILDHRDSDAQLTLKALASIDPCAERRQGPLQGLDFPDSAAGVGIREPQFTVRILPMKSL